MIIDRIWKQQPGAYFCLSTKTGSKKWEDHFFKAKDIGDIEDFIEQHRGRDVYFTPHGFKEARRLKGHAVPPNLLWADLDEADPRTIKIKPTVAIESSPGRFVGLWVIDKPMDEDLNRRLSYFVGADKSGWDFTQALRVPGSINYKYQSTPRVRLLWSDGPTYTRAQIEGMLPKAKKDVEETDDTDASTIYKKHERLMPPWMRRELLNGKPTEGKRSEMFWKLSQSLLEIGVSREDAFTLLKASPWNKFAGRRNEDQQINRELDKGVNKHIRGSAAKEEDEPRELLFRSMDQVEEENIEWVWYPYLARSELTIVEGDPGLGKSYMMQMVAKAICDGNKLPCVKEYKRVRGKVVYFDLENSAGTVTKKRLVSNGLEQLQNFIQCEEPFSIDDDTFMETVYEYIERTRPTMVVFDTLNTYIGKVDAFKGHEAQQAFVKFREIAKRFDCSVVVLRHLTKSSKERALYRGQGSISFAGLARVVISVGLVPDGDGARAMAVTKINVARPPKALSFDIESIPDTKSEQDRSRFVWGDFINLSPDEMLSATPEKEKANPAEAFLKEALEDGPADLSRLEKMAEARSISRRTLYRAADTLGIKKTSKGFGKTKRAVWALDQGSADD